jgi:hypothetical protein
LRFERWASVEKKRVLAGEDGQGEDNIRSLFDCAQGRLYGMTTKKDAQR